VTYSFLRIFSPFEEGVLIQHSRQHPAKTATTEPN
jgi:hypothetical protein